MAITTKDGPLFKPIQCLESQMNNEAKEAGRVYFCTNTGKIYADLKINNTLTRTLIANNYTYTLPEATDKALGGVTVGKGITVENGEISLGEENITEILGAAPLTSQNTAELSSGDSSSYNNSRTVKLTDGDATSEVHITGEGLVTVKGSNNQIKISTSATQNSASTTLPLAAGTASVGKEDGYARGDHVHPAQVDIKGNAGSADKVQITDIANASLTAYDLLMDAATSGSTQSALTKSSMNDVQVTLSNGTASVAGVSRLSLGNATKTGIAGNSSGELYLYNANGAAGILKPNTNSSSITAKMPSASGTLALTSQAIGSLSVSGTTITYTKADGTSGTIPTQDTTYSEATSTKLGLVKIGYTQSGKNYPVQLSNSYQMYVNVPWIDDVATTAANGLMSSKDKNKLEGIAEGANKYTLPTASSTLGGVMTDSTVTDKTGYTATPIIGGIPYYKSTLPNPNSLTVTASKTALTNAATSVVYDGSEAKSFTFNYASVGAAPASHDHSADNITSGTLALERIPTITNGKLGENAVAEINIAKGAVTNDKIASVAASKITGVIDASHIPGSYDEIKEYTSKDSFPTTGESDKIYVDTTTNLVYRWSGTKYVEISASLALGITEVTAFRGDFGQVAYAHATEEKKPSQDYPSGLYKIATSKEGHVISATAVTKDDITALEIPAQDTTYKAGTGLSLNDTTFTFNHANSIVAGTVSASKSTATVTTSNTLSHGDKIAIPSITYDNTGHITATSTTVFGLPAEKTAKLYAGKSATAANAATTNGNTYLTVGDRTSSDGTNTSVKISGSGLTSITSDASGNVTIASPLPEYLTTLTSTSFSKSLKVTEAWLDTGISGSNLKTGTYAVRVENVLSESTTEAWSGIMSWYDGTCSGDKTEEIILHNAGAADSDKDIYLRTARVVSGSMKLQIAGTYTAASAMSIKFTFRRLI